MALTADQRHALFLADRSQSTDVIAAAVDQVLADNPDADLLDCETAFRESAAQSFLIAGDPFEVVIGVQAWHHALAVTGLSPGHNRAVLLISSAIRPIGKRWSAR